VSTAAKPGIVNQTIGTVVIFAFILAWLKVPGGPASAVVNLAVGIITATIVVTTVVAFVQLYRVPAVDSTRAGPALRRMHNGGQRLWTHRRVAVPAVLVGALLLPYGLEGAALAVALYALGRAPKPETEPEPDAWYGARSMAMHLTRAGVLKEGIWLPYQPRVVRDDAHGVTVDVHLPFGMVAAQVVARRDALASSLGVPPARLAASAIADAPANVCRVFVGHAPAPGARAMVGSGETSEVADPTITRVS
jgi:hypothetical protein